MLHCGGGGGALEWDVVRVVLRVRVNRAAVLYIEGLRANGLISERWRNYLERDSWLIRAAT